MKTWSTESSLDSQSLPLRDLLSHERRFLALLAGRGFDVANADYESRGAHVRAFRCLPHTPTPAGLIVFVHSTGNDALYPHGPLVLDLLACGYEVFLFDLDGHGRKSSTVLAESPSPDAIVAAINQATQLGKPKSLHLVGHSFGGALAVAAANSAQLSSLTIISAPTTLTVSSGALMRELLSLARRSYWRLVVAYGISGLMPAMGKIRRQAYPIRLTRPNEKYPQFIAKIVLLINPLALAPGIKVPTLLIYGSNDKLTSPAQGQELHRAIINSEFYLAKGATHFTTPIEPDVIKRICDFMGANNR